MKAKSMIVKCLFFLVGCLLAAQVGAEGLLFPRTQREKVSYGLGVGMARHVKAQKIETAPDLMIKGLRDELSGKKTASPTIPSVTFNYD